MSETMVNYQNGRIYKLVCNVTGLQYVGSTTLSLHTRKAGHVQTYKRWKEGKARGCITSFKIIEGGDYDIVLLEEVPCDNKEQLHRAERRWIENLECVNIIHPTRTQAEYGKIWREKNADVNREKKKAWWQANIDENHQKKKEYRERNADIIRVKQREFYQANIDAERQKRREYRKANAEAINSKKKEKYNCPCGVSVSKSHKARHERSPKHVQWSQLEEEKATHTDSSISN